MNEILKHKIDLLEDKPGSYLMKDRNGTIIYVGKAKSLVKRVKQYFIRPQEGKVAKMVSEIEDFDVIETNSEKESLLLEINLIQKYYPKYNILLKDGKMYPYIAVKKNGMPSLKIAHKKNDEKHYDYFGPYPSSSSAYKVINILNMVYPIMKVDLTKDERNLYWYLHELKHPNEIDASNVDEKELRKKVEDFLNGDVSEVINEFKKQMDKASLELDFESAQKYKEKIDGINHIIQTQKIMMKDKIDRDVFAYSIRDGYIAMLFLLYRKGVLLGKNLYVEELNEDPVEAIQSSIGQFYMSHPKPKELLLSQKSFASLIDETYGIKVVVPSRGIKKDLLAMAFENAKAGLDQHFMTARLEDNSLDLLKELQDKLKMDKLPQEIELFDNAHTQGSDAIGGMVTFINGKKAPELYRKFNIRQSNKADDMASMKEVIFRRCSKLVNENLKYPDLIIVDGGITQVEAAKESMELANINGVKLAGLVKNDKHETNALMDGDTFEIIPLDKKSPLFFLLMRMQDEVHRYAITSHRGKRSKSLFNTFFDDIPGVGKKKKERLLGAYSSMDALMNASLNEIEQFTDKKTATLIYEKSQKMKKEQNNLEEEVKKIHANQK